MEEEEGGVLENVAAQKKSRVSRKRNMQGRN